MTKLVHSYKSQSFAGRVILENGRKKLKLNSPAFYNHQISKFELNTIVTLYVTNQKPKRTEQQNRYWWMYLTIASQETGHTPEELHEWAKTSCMPTNIVQVMGDAVRMKKSTTDLSVGEFCELVLNFQEKTGIQAPDTSSYQLSPLK